VRPWWWTPLHGGFDRLPGVLILELHGAEIARLQLDALFLRFMHDVLQVLERPRQPVDPCDYQACVRGAWADALDYDAFSTACEGQIRGVCLGGCGCSVRVGNVQHQLRH